MKINKMHQYVLDNHIDFESICNDIVPYIQSNPNIKLQLGQDNVYRDYSCADLSSKDKLLINTFLLLINDVIPVMHSLNTAKTPSISELNNAIYSAFEAGVKFNELKLINFEAGILKYIKTIIAAEQTNAKKIGRIKDNLVKVKNFMSENKEGVLNCFADQSTETVTNIYAYIYDSIGKKLKSSDKKKLSMATLKDPIGEYYQPIKYWYNEIKKKENSSKLSSNKWIKELGSCL